jgi:hypothetical protein
MEYSCKRENCFRLQGDTHPENGNKKKAPFAGSLSISLVRFSCTPELAISMLSARWRLFLRRRIGLFIQRPTQPVHFYCFQFYWPVGIGFAFGIFFIEAGYIKPDEFLPGL